MDGNVRPPQPGDWWRNLVAVSVMVAAMVAIGLAGEELRRRGEREDNFTR